HDEADDREVAAFNGRNGFQRSTLLFRNFYLGQRLDLETREAIGSGTLRRLAVQYVVDEEAADLVAVSALEVEELHGPLIGAHGRQIERKAASDDAVRLEQH